MALSATTSAAPTAPKMMRPRPDDAEVLRRLERAALPVRAYVLLCQYNSDVLKQDADGASLTYYHSTAEPSLSVPAYLERIARYSECGVEGVLLGLRLVGRCHATAGVTLTRLSAHRLAITGLTIGVKAHMDRFRSNRTVAKAGGLQLKELNGLEYAFFRELGYRAVVTQEELEHMERHAARAMELFEAGSVAAAVQAAEDAFSGQPRSPGMPRVPSTESLKSLTDADESLYGASPQLNSSSNAGAPSALAASFASAMQAASLPTAELTSQSPLPSVTATRHHGGGASLPRFPLGTLSTSFGGANPSAPSEASDTSVRSERAALTRFTSRTAALWNPLMPPDSGNESSILERSTSVC